MIQTIPNDTLSLWREEGRRQIPQNFEVFRSLVAQARDFAQRGNYDAAAVYGEMAATYANFRHCGIYTSPELEKVLIDIGRKVISQNSDICKNKHILEIPKKINNILHVATSVEPVGGLSKMLGRWILQDTERSHSLVLTRQLQTVEEPKFLTDAVINSGGKIYKLDETIGSLTARAQRLNKIAATADMVVLHMYNHDVIPIIAFANQEQVPPIIFLNHADHTFWLGASISDVIANLRESGMRLSQKRRGIETKQNLLLPTIVEPNHRVLARQEAKKILGLSENSIVLLSIARALKYKTIDGISYADAHIPLLEKYPQAVLVVVGCGNRQDWSNAIQQTQGRIICHPQREDTDIFYQAADIYVDSFPFVSITSLLEAGTYGIPLVSRYPYSSDACEIFGADMPGLTDNLIRVGDIEQYTAVLSRLVEDEAYRLSLGEATRKKIVDTHTAKQWQHFLENVYHLAATLPRVKKSAVAIDQMFIGEPDVYMPSVHDMSFDVDTLLKFHLTLLPIKERWSQLFRLAKNPSFYHKSDRLSPFKYLLPEWLLYRVRKII
ncbi:family 2 glycosyl transferase [Tolypothrix tenuis PCC 7101]|uniref:Family 2 glycosyl transferase n=1 Tax=Tolypothrix tenuis PCC 7101 TaxID=231146 RepID=A0A1Z4MVZ7_9CYAN|nr:family 2 glycosyl transferase [Tolypothrix tenuis PCC 7101]BAZ71891.1 family 2 glycosyl transferase [Aulosira laxa NIES-50]